MRLTAAALAATLLLAAPAAAQSPPVATVDGAGEVTEEQFDHWMRIAARSSRLRRVPPRGTARFRDLRGQVMSLLLHDLWLRGEAAQRGLVVTEEEVRQAFVRSKRRAFPRPGGLGRFLRREGYRIADLLFRTRIELLSTAIRKAVVAAAAPTAEDVRAEYDRERAWRVLPERRHVVVGERPTPAAARTARRRLVLYARRGRLPAAVFRRRRGLIYEQGRWIWFRVVRVIPPRERSFEEAAPLIRAKLGAEREQAALDAFVEDFERRWRAATSCAQRYATSDCGRIAP
ncbi:MAG TPA: hypothetical protein VF529_01005 [Solirubrobacteraceae bacterium]